MGVNVQMQGPAASSKSDTPLEDSSMWIDEEITSETAPEKVPQPWCADGPCTEKFLDPWKRAAFSRNAKLKNLLRRETRTPLLAVTFAVLVLLTLALGIYIAVPKRSQCPDPQANAEAEASRAENAKNGEVLPPCGDGWIWFRNKCYFFSEKEANWDEAKRACASWNSSLAVIDNQREMDFVMRYKGVRDHWIGLRRDSGQPWKWVNGTEFSNWFIIGDYSECAFLNSIVLSSGCHSKHNWICTTEEPSDARKRTKRELGMAHFS